MYYYNIIFIVIELRISLYVSNKYLKVCDIYFMPNQNLYNIFKIKTLYNVVNLLSKPRPTRLEND